MPRWCWAASTSVGASSAACPPASTTCSIARSATDRLAGADLALQQPVHRMRRGQIRGDLLADPALAVGQLVRQPASNAASEAAVGA